MMNRIDPFPIFARVKDPLDDQNVPPDGPEPVGMKLGWEEVGYDVAEALAAFSDVRSRDSSVDGQGEPTYTLPGYVLTSPVGLIFPQRDTEGQSRQWWVAAPQVYAAIVDSVGLQEFNADYVVTTVDQSITFDTTDHGGPRPVLDRWGGIDHLPRAQGDRVLLVVAGPDPFSDMNLLAFETPNIIDCPPPSSAGTLDAGAFGGFT